MNVKRLILSSIAIVVFGYIALFCYTIDSIIGLFKRIINGNENKKIVWLMKILRHILTAIYIAILGSIALLFLAMDDIYRFFRDKIIYRHDNKKNRW